MNTHPTPQPTPDGPSATGSPTRHPGLNPAERAAAAADDHMSVCPERIRDCVSCRGRLRVIRAVLTAARPVIESETLLSGAPHRCAYVEPDGTTAGVCHLPGVHGGLPREAPTQYTRDQVSTALNAAADDVTGQQHADTGAPDIANLVVNAGMHYLDHPGSSLQDAIRANYDEEPREVLAWCGVEPLVT